MKTSRSAHVAATRPRVVIIRRPSLPGLEKCPDCAGSIGMVTPEEAAAVANVDTRTIYRWCCPAMTRRPSRAPSRPPPRMSTAGTIQMSRWRLPVVTHLSGIAQCSGPTVLANEGINQSVIGVAGDQAGNTAEATVSDVNIDKKPPLVAIASPADGAVFHTEQSLTVSFAANDPCRALSRSQRALVGRRSSTVRPSASPAGGHRRPAHPPVEALDAERRRAPRADPRKAARRRARVTITPFSDPRSPSPGHDRVACDRSSACIPTARSPAPRRSHR